MIPHYLRSCLLAANNDTAGSGSHSGLDFENPADKLYAFGKLWATYAGEPAFSAFHGLMFGRMHSHKGNRGFEDIPRVILDYAERHHPQYLETCGDWEDGAPIGAWEAYAREVPPEVEQHVE